MGSQKGITRTARNAEAADCLKLKIEVTLIASLWHAEAIPAAK